MSGVPAPPLFEDFMVCPSNEDAVAAARAVAASTPDAPNPLLIVGAPAEGKTHLVRALVAAYRRQHPGARTAVLTTERLERFFRSAVMQETLHKWRAELARLGLLVIEDVQFVDGQELWPLLLRRVLQELYAHGGYVVLTRDPPAARQAVELPEATQVVRLHAPDLTLRRAVAKRAAAEFGLTIPDDVAEFIAGHCDNLRQIQGAVMRVHASAHLNFRERGWAPATGWRY